MFQRSTYICAATRSLAGLCNLNKYKTEKATPTNHGVHQVQCIYRKQIEPFSGNSFTFKVTRG